MAAELTRNHMRGLFTSVLQVSDSQDLGPSKRTATHVLPMLIKYDVVCSASGWGASSMSHVAMDRRLSVCIYEQGGSGGAGGVQDNSPN